MLNRRQFLSAAASVAMFARAPRAVVAQAARYDLIIRGGRVIDPSVRLDAIRDVAISGGRIAAVEANIAADAADTIDARGKLVVPGLIDIHTHTALRVRQVWCRTAFGVERPRRIGARDLPGDHVVEDGRHRVALKVEVEQMKAAVLPGVPDAGEHFRGA
jgi:hypothetical protein